MIVHAITRIGIIRALNESVWILFGATTQKRQNNSDNQSEKDSNNQESIQSSTTHVPSYQMGKKQNTIKITNKSQEANMLRRPQTTKKKELFS